MISAWEYVSFSALALGGGKQKMYQDLLKCKSTFKGKSRD